LSVSQKETSVVGRGFSATVNNEMESNDAMLRKRRVFIIFKINQLFLITKKVNQIKLGKTIPINGKSGGIK
jgi:hypothetical protein